MSQDEPAKPPADQALPPQAGEPDQTAPASDVQHVVRNLLGVIRSIARRTAETSGTVEEFAMNFEGRVSAFARALSLLGRDSENGVDLEYLLAEELLAIQAHDGERVEISGPEIQLRPKAAETFGLAIHELTTNALRHGALGQPGGKLKVSWEVRKGPSGSALVFDWMETGARKLMPVPTRRGFGIQMLEETLPFDLGASSELRFESTGFQCRISLPVNEQVFVVAPNH